MMLKLVIKQNSKIYELWAIFLLIYFCFLVYPAQARDHEVPFFQDSNVTEKTLKDKNISLDSLTSLNFLTSLDFPIFNYLDEDGYLVGYNIDLMRAICKELALGQRCNVKAVPFQELIPRLLKGEADVVIAGLKPLRYFEGVEFTPAYLKFPARFVTRKEDSFTHFNAEKMRDKIIGVVQDTIHADTFKKYFLDTQLKFYANNKTLYEGLLQKEVDAIFGDGLSLSGFLGSEEGLKCCSFSDGPYKIDNYGLSIAYAKENKELGLILTYTLKILEQKHIFQELYMRYFPIGFY